MLRDFADPIRDFRLNRSRLMATAGAAAQQNRQ
jgi:hypothetical protein